MKYIIANWKANKTVEEAKEWSDKFLSNYQPRANLTPIICPPFHLVQGIYESFRTVSSVAIGSQDLSSFEDGAYTGEVTAKSLSSFITYALIGHSERRTYGNESENTVAKKVSLAKKYGIEPILCVRNENDNIYSDSDFIAYEPVAAIGTGKNESVDTVLAMREKMDLPAQMKFIYGGSVTSENSSSYINHELIDGLLVGTASLDPLHFCSILESIR